MKSLICGLVLAAFVGLSTAQTDTTFTYHGTLSENGNRANGNYDLVFKLWDAVSGGAQAATPVSLTNVSISAGLFTAELDFGAAAFDNSQRWIQVTVQGTVLNPRQPMTRTPYSIQTRGIYVDPNHNVGIGTSAPSTPLHVESDEQTTIYGVNTATSGFKYAVRGVSHSASGGIGVLGQTSGFTGNMFGVYGQSNSTSGTGVYGESFASTGTTYGGRFISWSSTGKAVYGQDKASTGTTYAGRFESASTTGHGVYGEATATTGINYGGRFESNSTVGRGVFGLAGATTGVNYGVVGHTRSPSGFSFYASGSGTSYGESSSRRWKNNIVNIDDPLRKLAQLRGVYYDWDEEHGGHHDLGMIAEEVGKVLPEIVQYEENGYDAIGMDYSKMTPLLVEAVNALQAKQDHDMATLREAHANEINDLRQQLADLQQIVERLASIQEKENKE